MLAPAVALLSLLGLAPVLTTAYKFIAGISVWLDLLGITLPFSCFTFAIHRFSYKNRLRPFLQELEKHHKKLLKDADAEAWRWALAEEVHPGPIYVNPGGAIGWAYLLLF